MLAGLVVTTPILVLWAHHLTSAERAAGLPRGLAYLGRGARGRDRPDEYVHDAVDLPLAARGIVRNAGAHESHAPHCQRHGDVVGERGQTRTPGSCTVSGAACSSPVPGARRGPSYGWVCSWSSVSWRRALEPVDWGAAGAETAKPWPPPGRGDRASWRDQTPFAGSSLPQWLHLTAPSAKPPERQ